MQGRESGTGSLSLLRFDDCKLHPLEENVVQWGSVIIITLPINCSFNLRLNKHLSSSSPFFMHFTIIDKSATSNAVFPSN